MTLTCRIDGCGRSVRAKGLCSAHYQRMRTFGTTDLKARGHGHAVGNKRSHTYKIWENMVDRCENPKAVSYKYYGARGISVCDSWRQFAHFLRDMGVAPAAMTLDREDVDGHYCKENCRWATRLHQARNRRDTVRLECMGQTLTLGEWAERTGIRRVTIWQRIHKLNWTIERALTEPPDQSKVRK